MQSAISREEMPAAPSSIYSRIGQLIRAARREAGLTQDQVAERLGLTRTSITNIESGRQRFQVHVLFLLAEALGVTPIAFLPASPDEHPEQPEVVRERLERERELGEDARAWVHGIVSEATR